MSAMRLFRDGGRTRLIALKWMAETPPLPRRVVWRDVPSFWDRAQGPESTGVLPGPRASEPGRAAAPANNARRKRPPEQRQMSTTASAAFDHFQALVRARTKIKNNPQIHDVRPREHLTSFQ